MAEPDSDHSAAADPVAEQAAHVEHAAGAIRRSTEQQKDSADRRTELAADRTVLAAERTYAAWVRTGLTALASGVGARALLGRVVPVWLAASAGALLIAFAAFCFVAAVWRELQPGTPPPKPDIRKLPPALLLVLNGFLVLVSLAALAGVLFAPGRNG